MTSPMSAMVNPMVGGAEMLRSRAMLTKVPTYHVVPGTMTAMDLMARIKSGGGTAMLTTVQGSPLKAMMSGSPWC